LKKWGSRITLAVLLLGMLSLAFNIEQSEAESSLLLEMNVDKTIITVGEEINITLTLKNIGETSVTITYTPPLFDVFCCGPEGCYKWSDGMWNLYRYVNGKYHPPKPGNYHLLGICYPAGIETPYTITVTVTGSTVSMEGPYFTWSGTEYWIIIRHGRRPLRVVSNV